MNAPLRTMTTCALGHLFFGGQCAACNRKAPSMTVREERRIRQAKAGPKRRKRLQVERLPDGSVCGIHSNTGPTCKRCADANAANAKTLAETTPYHEILKRGDAMRREPTPEMVRESSRMFAHNSTLTPIKSEDHR